MKGLYLNTPPKPKQARTVELQEAEQLELEGNMSLEEENKVKRGNRSSELEAATEWTPWRELVAALHGAHAERELDQQRWPWSINDVGTGQGVAQWAIGVIEARGWCTSIVKRKAP